MKCMEFDIPTTTECSYNNGLFLLLFGGWTKKKIISHERDAGASYNGVYYVYHLIRHALHRHRIFYSNLNCIWNSLAKQKNLFKKKNWNSLFEKCWEKKILKNWIHWKRQIVAAVFDIEALIRFAMFEPKPLDASSTPLAPVWTETGRHYNRLSNKNFFYSWLPSKMVCISTRSVKFFLNISNFVKFFA